MFSLDWSHFDLSYSFLTFSLLAGDLQLLCADQAWGWMVFPMWPAQTWMGIVHWLLILSARWRCCVSFNSSYYGRDGASTALCSFKTVCFYFTSVIIVFWYQLHRAEGVNRLPTFDYKQVVCITPYDNDCSASRLIPHQAHGMTSVWGKMMKWEIAAAATAIIFASWRPGTER